MVVPRPLSVEQIAAPLLPRKSGVIDALPLASRLRQSREVAEKETNFVHLILRRIPEFLGVSGRGAVADSERLRALFRTRFTIETSRASLAGCRPPSEPTLMNRSFALGEISVSLPRIPTP